MINAKQGADMTAKFRWNLREIRELKKKSRREIIRATPISYSTLVNLENKPYSSRIDALTLKYLTEFLNCEMHDLVQLVDDGNPEPEPEKPKQKKG